MSEPKKRVVCVGEVMLELSRGAEKNYTAGCGGDTFNTAIYLARNGVTVSYATALGDDHYSDSIVSLAEVEGVATDLILRVPGRLPGLYIIETDGSGERSFHYWRNNAPARELFELPDWGRIAESLVSAHVVYFSGITLALYSNVGLGRFFAVLDMAREKGMKIAFDGNFRPKLWNGDLARARLIFTQALKRANMALPTFDDEALLWGDKSPEMTIERMKLFGIPEIAVKNGQNSALIYADGQQDEVTPPHVAKPVDTTAAGDSFNAAYLAARLSGTHPFEAAKSGHRLAAEKIQHRGAIMPRQTSAIH